MLPSAKWFARVDHEILPPLIVPLLATALLFAAGAGSARAANTFVIADGEGYGIMDCLTDGKSCGRVVADAWCEAHGHGAATSYGRASDITGATPVSTSTPTQIQPDAAVVACGD